MISVSEATERILDRRINFGRESASLRQSYGRILAEDLLADRDFPPFDRVAMDGIAIAFEAFEQGRRIFPIEGVRAAGAPQVALQDVGHCLEVMTGAILPHGADTVIRYEDVEIANGQARLCIDHIRRGQNAHPQGADRRRGELIIPAGRLIGPSEAGVAATVGKDHLQVYRLPAALIFYTGDELVEVAATPAPHQIRASNAFTLDALLQEWGIRADIQHLTDARSDVRTQLGRSLEQYDLILLSGGVSKGKFDFIPGALEALGVQKQFHQVRQRPGKPFWFGYDRRATVFAFPGNPVSAFICACRYLLPWLRQSMGAPPAPARFASLADPFFNKSPLSYFLPVRTTFTPDGRLLATPQTGHGSGDLANLTDVDGFLELPPGPGDFTRGQSFPLISYR